MFKDKVAVVTGAGGTLCSVIAVDLAKNGAKVVLVGRTEEKILKTLEKIKEIGGEALTFACDVTDAEARELILSFAKDFGKSYRQDELSRCSLYLERMRAREQKLIKESAKKKKVIYTVAICSALAVIILII